MDTAAFFCAGLLLAEGHAVGTLVLSRIGLVGTHQNPVQGTIVLAFAVMGTLVHSALNGLVGMAVHKIASFAFWVREQYVQPEEKHTGKVFHSCILSENVIC